MQEFDLKGILVNIIDRLKLHESREENGKMYKDDLLWSILKLLKSLFITHKDRCNYDELLNFYDESGLINEIFYECLFYIPGKTQSKCENKCKTDGTRTIAHGILLEIVQTLKPKEMNEYLSTYFLPMIESLEAPTDWNHQPSEGGSREAGFMGIKNPSNVCYMNSSLQQLFLVPSFRYGILSITTNPEAENLVEIDEEILKDNKFIKEDFVNDNMVYQYQRMLGFLELSDK